MVFIYLVNYNEFPESLSKEELIYNFKLMKQGNLKSRDKIFIHNLRLVLLIINKYQDSIYEMEDLFQIGCIGLMKAIKSFDLNREIKFSSFATICIQNEILMHFRKNKKNLKNVSFEQLFYIDNNKEKIICKDFLSDFSYSILDDYLKTIDISILRQSLSKLRERDREITMLYFGFYNDREYTQKEIATIFNMSQKMVSKVIRKSIIVLREAIECANKGIEYESKVRRLRK